MELHGVRLFAFFLCVRRTRKADHGTARSETFRALFMRKADATIKDVRGATPLHIAAQNGDRLALSTLALRTPIDILTSKGATALALAALYGHKDCAEYLIRAGASMDMELRGGHKVGDFVRMLENPETLQLLRAHE